MRTHYDLRRVPDILTTEILRRQGRETHTRGEELGLCGRVETEVPQHEHRALLVVLRATGAKLQEQIHSICNIHQSLCHKVKVCYEVKVYLYIAHYLVLMSAQGASHITPWQTSSVKHHRNTYGKISAILPISAQRLF